MIREDKFIKISFGVLAFMASIFFSIGVWMTTIQVQANNLDTNFQKHLTTGEAYREKNDERWQEIHDSLIEIKTTLGIKRK